MEFFNCLKNKIKESYVIIIILFIVFIINDLFLFLIISKGENVTLTESSKVDLKTDHIDGASKKIKVDIKGYVKRPNVYDIDEGSNVLDLINLAGGLKKGASTDNINLSKKLQDEMVVIISKKTDLKKNSGNSLNLDVPQNDARIQNDNVVGNISAENEGVSASNGSALVNINSATIEELLLLPGIGESKAKAIIEYRNTSLFNSIDDIKNISGIGDSLFEKIKDKIIV